MSLPRFKSQGKLASLPNDQQKKSIPMRKRVNSNSTQNLKNVSGLILPSIFPPSTQQTHSVKHINEQAIQYITGQSEQNNSTNIYEGEKRRKSISMHNIHNLNDVSAISYSKNNYDQSTLKSKQFKSETHRIPMQRKNLSIGNIGNFGNISNASTLNISQNNSKYSAQDFSIILNDIQSSTNMVKKSKNLNNSHIISSSKLNFSTLNMSTLNTSRLQSKQKDEQLQSLEKDIMKMIEMYNNNCITPSANEPLKQFQLQESVLEKQEIDEKEKEDEEEDSIYNVLKQGSINERDTNNVSEYQQKKAKKQTTQRLQLQLKEMNSIHLLYKSLIAEIMSDTKKYNLYTILNEIIDISERHCNNSEFTIDNYSIFAEVCRDIGDYNKSVQLLHHARLISSMNARYDIKLSLYKKISEILSESSQFNKSLIYLKKMLRLAWKLRNQDREIEAYDLIGKNLMQIGEVDLSEFFHTKSMSNDKEPINSPLRIAGEIGVKTKYGLQQTNDEHDYKSDSDDDLDLASFPKSKQDENIIRNESLQQKKSSYFALPKILTNFGKRYQFLGRLNIPSYLRDDLEIKVSQRLSHLSQNRDLKNFYVYTYKNQNFWIKDGDYNQQQKYYMLKKNYLKYKQNINKSVKFLQLLQLKCIKQIKNIEAELNHTKILNSDILLQ